MSLKEREKKKVFTDTVCDGSSGTPFVLGLHGHCL